MNKGRKVISVLSTILLLSATALVVFVFVIRLTGAKPKIFGYYIFNVASDSMTPMLEVNDVILVKQCGGEDVHKGDVITYRGQSGELAGKDITHKVIEEPVKDSGGTIRIKTKGTKDGAIEDPVLTGEQVIGKYVRTLKILSFIFTIFKQWYGLAIFLGVIVLLMGAEIRNLVKLSKKADAIESLSKEQIKEILKQAEEESKSDNNGE